MNTETGANCEFGPCETKSTAITDLLNQHIAEIRERIANILKSEVNASTQFIRVHRATPETLLAEANAGGWTSTEEMMGGWMTEEYVLKNKAYVPAETETHPLDVQFLAHAYVTLFTVIDGEPFICRDIVAWVSDSEELWVDSEDFA